MNPIYPTIVDVTEAWNLTANKHAELVSEICRAIMEKAAEGEFKYDTDIPTEAVPQYTRAATVLCGLGFIADVTVNNNSPTSRLLVTWYTIPDDFPKPKLGKFRSPTLMRG